MITRRHTKTVFASALMLLLLSGTASAVFLLKTSGETMSQFATELIRISDEGERSQLVLDYDDQQRTEWHFIPKPTRKGLVLSEMDSAQRTAALRLLRGALSDIGYDKTTTIMALEGLLRELEGPGSEARRDPEKYYVTLFGAPAENEPWGFSFEGHHLSLNFVVEDDQIVESTPQFFGANPAEIKNEVPESLRQGTDLRKGTRVLANEEKIAFDLINALSDDARQRAVIAEEAFSEIRAAGEPQPPREPPAGIAFSELSGANQRMLRRLVDAYLESMPSDVQETRLGQIEQTGWDQVHFAWAGATKPGIGHYYRIQGPSFLIEFVNTQPDAAGNPANHIHCVWRDMNGDFYLPAE